MTPRRIRHLSFYKKCCFAFGCLQCSLNLSPVSLPAANVHLCQPRPTNVAHRARQHRTLPPLCTLSMYLAAHPLTPFTFQSHTHFHIHTNTHSCHLVFLVSLTPTYWFQTIWVEPTWCFQWDKAINASVDACWNTAVGVNFSTFIPLNFGSVCVCVSQPVAMGMYAYLWTPVYTVYGLYAWSCVTGSFLCVLNMHVGVEQCVCVFVCVCWLMVEAVALRRPYLSCSER